MTGNTPLHAASSSGNGFQSSICRKTKILQHFYKLKLLFIFYSGHRDKVELLIVNGANIEAKDNDGYTPLHAALSTHIGFIKNVELQKCRKFELMDDGWEHRAQLTLCDNLNISCTRWKAFI